MFNLFKNNRQAIISMTDIGDRDVNQDSHESMSVVQHHLLCSADGLGGHEAGELASQILCQKIREIFSPQMQNEMNKDQFSQLIQQALDNTNHTLKSHPKASAAHTTMALAWIDNDQVLTAHVGDSRVMAISPKSGRLWRTRDHSVVQMLVDHGEVDEQDMGTHSEQGKLTKSISAEKQVEASIKQYPSLNKGEILLTCTDGFWEHINLDELKKLAQKPSKKHLQKLVELSKKRATPNSDNITVQIFVKI
ncbi:MAG: protein phosphatase 2C domain-containing protein [Marinicella sp.]